MSISSYSITSVETSTPIKRRINSPPSDICAVCQTVLHPFYLRYVQSPEYYYDTYTDISHRESMLRDLRVSNTVRSTIRLLKQPVPVCFKHWGATNVYHGGSLKTVSSENHDDQCGVYNKAITIATKTARLLNLPIRLQMSVLPGFWKSSPKSLEDALSQVLRQYLPKQYRHHKRYIERLVLGHVFWNERYDECRKYDISIRAIDNIVRKLIVRLVELNPSQCFYQMAFDSYQFGNSGELILIPVEPGYAPYLYHPAGIIQVVGDGTEVEFLECEQNYGQPIISLQHIPYNERQISEQPALLFELCFEDDLLSSDYESEARQFTVRCGNTNEFKFSDSVPNVWTTCGCAPFELEKKRPPPSVFKKCRQRIIEPKNLLLPVKARIIHVPPNPTVRTTPFDVDKDSEESAASTIFSNDIDDLVQDDLFNEGNCWQEESLGADNEEMILTELNPSADAMIGIASSSSDCKGCIVLDSIDNLMMTPCKNLEKQYHYHGSDTRTVGTGFKVTDENDVEEEDDSMLPSKSKKSRIYEVDENDPLLSTNIPVQLIGASLVMNYIRCAPVEQRNKVVVKRTFKGSKEALLDEIKEILYYRYKYSTVKTDAYATILLNVLLEHLDGKGEFKLDTSNTTMSRNICKKLLTLLSHFFAIGSLCKKEDGDYKIDIFKPAKNIKIVPDRLFEQTKRMNHEHDYTELDEI